MEKSSIWFQVVAAFSATLLHLSVGTFLGWPSSTYPLLARKDSSIPVTSEEWSWVVSISCFGMICGPIPTGYLVDLLGRKLILAAVAVPLLVAWLILAVASSVAELYVARFIGGLGQGIAFAVGPMYLAEISEDRIRGAMGTLFQVMMNLGTLFEYCVGPYVSYTTLAVSSAVFPLIFLIIFVWMPESPYYLLSKDMREEAELSLMKLRRKKNKESVKEELAIIETTLLAQKNEKGSPLDLLRQRGIRNAFFIVLFLLFAQVFSGIIVILSYSTTIFLSSGSGIDANISTIVVGVVTLLASVCSSLLVERAGRKPLLLVSSGGCFLCMLGLGLYFLYAPLVDSTMNIDWIPLALLILYIILYMIGLGPLPWAIAGEIMPSSVSGYAISIASMTNAALTLIVIKIYQILSDEQGSYIIFFMFAAICSLSTVLIFLFVPETKGKSLLDIYNAMNKSQEATSTVCSVATIATNFHSDLEISKKSDNSDTHRLASTENTNSIK